MEMPAVVESANLPSEESSKEQKHAENNRDSCYSEEGSGNGTNPKQEDGTEDVFEVPAHNDKEETTDHPESTNKEADTDKTSGGQCTVNEDQEKTDDGSSNASIPISQNLETLPHRTQEASSKPGVSDETKVDLVELPQSTERTDQGNSDSKVQEGGTQGEENGRCKHGPKRVTFPCDDDIVSGALEPKDPWRHAQNVTVEDVITSYTQACQKLNCKQIPKLIRQLQELTDLSGRVESLDLKGKIQCVTFIFFFWCVQGASALFDMIEYYESATHLNISFNKHIGTRGWQAAAHMMRKVGVYVCKCVCVYVCVYIYIYIYIYICEGMKEQRQGLVTLVLWNNQLTHAGMVYMSMCLPHTQTLETLNLGHNAIGNEGVRHLKNGLIGNRSVLRLGLASAKLTCEGAVAVAEFVAESPRLLRLDLRENEIKTGGLMALSLALRVNQSLLRLDLDREPKKEAVKSFIETQKALLAEIQNGCRRNFILAKEKEERLQQSASMAEIASAAEEEDSSTAPIENSLPTEDCNTAPEDTTTNNSSEQDEEEITPDPDPQGQDSDSDTEDEVEEEKPVAETKPVVNSVQSPPGQVAVSSPGRGHKIFLVTRVENPNTTGGGMTSQDVKGSLLTGATSPGGPSLSNGLEADLGRTASSCDDHKDSLGTYSDTELEDLLRDASSEPDPSLNIITL
ncbi:protein phosphatase 1 regulatory subunit 37 [Pyxicephalus adspersus]